MKNVLNRLALVIALSGCSAVLPSHPRRSSPSPTIYDQKVAEVNGEAISKIDVEDHMPPGLAYQLNMFRRLTRRRANGIRKMESDWMTMYVPPFKEALRKTIRERPVIQYFKIEKMTLEEKDFQKRVKETSERISHDSGVSHQFTLPDIEKIIRNSMMIRRLPADEILQSVGLSTRPDIEAEYSEHPEKYQRKAGVKVRLIRVDRKVTDRFTGVSKIRDNPASGILEEIRSNIVQYGASFCQKKRKTRATMNRGLLAASCRASTAIHSSSWKKPTKSSPQR